MQHEDRVGVNVVCGVVTELAIVYTLVRDSDSRYIFAFEGIDGGDRLTLKRQVEVAKWLRLSTCMDAGCIGVMREVPHARLTCFVL
jgi:hypothetical protein